MDDELLLKIFKTCVLYIFIDFICSIKLNIKTEHEPKLALCCELLIKFQFNTLFLFFFFASVTRNKINHDGVDGRENAAVSTLFYISFIYFFFFYFQFSFINAQCHFNL